MITRIFQKTRTLSRETIIELKKASWPNKVELRDSTIVVLAAAILLAIAVFITDWSLFNWVAALSQWVN